MARQHCRFWSRRLHRRPLRAPDSGSGKQVVGAQLPVVFALICISALGRPRRAVVEGSRCLFANRWAQECAGAAQAQQPRHGPRGSRRADGAPPGRSRPVPRRTARTAARRSCRPRSQRYVTRTYLVTLPAAAANPGSPRSLAHVRAGPKAGQRRGHVQAPCRWLRRRPWTPATLRRLPT